jgi:hypothetical protein
MTDALMRMQELDESRSRLSRQRLDERVAHLQERADLLTTEWKTRLDELNALHVDHMADHHERLEKLVPWLSDRQTELQQLQIELSELSALYAAYRADPVAPPGSRVTD